MDSKEEGKNRTEVVSANKEFSLDFELSPEQQKAVIQCIQEHGKVSIKLGTPSVSRLPGQGLLNDTEGKLID